MVGANHPNFTRAFLEIFLDALDWTVFAICFLTPEEKTQTTQTWQRVALAR